MSSDFSANSANPYSVSVDINSKEGSNDLSQSLIILARWQRVFAVLLYLAAVLTSLVAGMQLIGMAFFTNSPAAMGTGAFSIAIILLIIYVFYWTPAQRLNRAASMAKKSALSNEISMVDIIKTQQAFWQYVGRLFVVIIVIYAIVLLTVIAIPFLSR